jgi:hypothetical protein
MSTKIHIRGGGFLPFSTEACTGPTGSVQATPLQVLINKELSGVPITTQVEILTALLTLLVDEDAAFHRNRRLERWLGSNT